MKVNSTRSQKRQIGNGRLPNESPGFDRWGISALEACLCAVVFISCILLHFVPVYTRIGLPIVLGLSLVSFATPISGLLYLSAAQVIPDAPGSPLSSAQMALAGFFLWQLAKGKTMDLFRIGWPLLSAVSLFFVWGAGLALSRGDYMFGALLIFAILTGCAVAVLVRQSGNRLAACLMIFLIGHGLAMCLFWMVKLHLGAPVQNFNTDIYGDSTMVGMRIGTARGNSNMLGVPMALACIGIIGWFITQPKKNRLGGLIALICLAAIAPPLIGSGSRGAVLSVACGSVFLVVFGLFSRKSFVSVPLAMAGLVVVLFFGWHRIGLNEHWQEMVSRQEEQIYETGNVLIAGREREWKAAWNGVLNSPFTGGGHVARLSYIENPEMWASHSTYLDAGLAGGFPGMALFGWLVLKPILELWPRKNEPAIGWLLAVYLVSIIAIGSTSAMQSKHFWMLWGMAAVFFLPAMPGIKHNRLEPLGSLPKENEK